MTVPITMEILWMNWSEELKLASQQNAHTHIAHERGKGSRKNEFILKYMCVHILILIHIEIRSLT